MYMLVLYVSPIKEANKLHWCLFSKDGIKVLIQMHSATHAAGNICHVAVKF